MLTERFNEAFRYAHRLHRDQTRKGTPIPYISHLMSVAALVVEHGGNEDQAIAGLLHDAVEDTIVATASPKSVLILASVSAPP